MDALQRIEPFLLQFLSLSAHAYTRGTWIAPESSPIDRSHGSPPFATPSGVTIPILLKWILVWEHPTTRAVWFGKALPRVWLSEGEEVTVRQTPTAYGRVSMTLKSSIATTSSIACNVTLPKAWGDGASHGVTAAAAAPAGGVVVRLRAPGKAKLKSVTVGGKVWTTFDAAKETISFSAAQLAAVGLGIQKIIATFQ